MATPQPTTAARPEPRPEAGRHEGRGPSMSPRLAEHHGRTRRGGVNPWVYWPVRFVLQPLILIWFRVKRVGREHVPREGGVIVAANHRSFLDPFVVGVCIRRPVYFVAKQELFEKRFTGWLLNCLGAFPIRRGESDEDSVVTARAVLERGDVVVIFPEGTRIRRGSLGRPRRGVGRLALESGAPVVPVAITGSENARRGWIIRPAKVCIRLGRPLTFPRVEQPSPGLAQGVTARIWPCIELQWEWLGGLPPLRQAAVLGAGPMGTALAALLARAGLEVQLGTRSPEQAERIARERENERLPGVTLPERLEPKAAGAIELQGVDLLILAVPARDLPQAVGQVADRLGERTAVLLVSKGLVPPLGTTPSRYVAERLPARAVAALAGPAFADESVQHGATVLLASADEDLRRQLAEALNAGGLAVEPSADVAGCELAGVAKNTAALAAAAAAPRGMNAAGTAAGMVFGEVHRLGRALGARSDTFLGIAGAGDLVGTALASKSRNRRAGELIGRGVSAKQAAGTLNGSAESLDTVPLLADALARAGIEAPATSGLRNVLAGDLGVDEWLERLRSTRPKPPIRSGTRG